MTTRSQYAPQWDWIANFRISQAVRVGDFVYTSGQVAYDRHGNVVGKGDMKAQAKQTFENLREVLALAGATMDDVVKITAFITDMSKYGEYSEARAQSFARNIPASSTVAIHRLVNQDLMLEVEAVAHTPRS